jgi:hypothetical protein
MRCEYGADYIRGVGTYVDGCSCGVWQLGRVWVEDEVGG